MGVVILGEGPQRGDLERLAATTPDRIRVALPGYVEDAASALGACDLALIPSRMEGFGLAAVEAMAHGLPLLATRVDALPEIVGDYAAGRLMDPASLESPDAMATEIVAALGLARTGGGVPPRFSVERMVEAYLRVYRELVSGGSTNPGP